jgi:hypothetical protein
MTENKSKLDKIKDTDKGEHANKETAFVGLEINIKPFRKWMKEHYERHSKTVGVVNAHYILATVDQVLFYSLLNTVSENFKKDKSGMYDVSLESLKNSVKLNPSFNNTFGLCVDKFDDNLDYQKQLPIDKKSLNEYLNKYTFHDNFRVHLNKDSHNFLCYLVVQANTMLSNTALVMSEFAKKSRVNSNSIISALKVHFSGKLYEDIMKKVDCVDTLLQNKAKKDSEKGETNEDEKTEKTEKTEKKKDDSSESESEEEDKADSSESGSESEEEEKPKKKVPVKEEQKPKKVVKPKNHK